MRKFVLMSMMVLSIPVNMIAQDDMYFVPTKKNVAASTADFGMPSGTYYSGSNRDVDEYNRQGSHVQRIDSAGNDIIEFDGMTGVYPSGGQTDVDDYEYTRRMSRFDDYSWYDPYWAGYHDGRFDAWGWYDPWFYSSWYYSHGIIPDGFMTRGIMAGTIRGITDGTALGGEAQYLLVAPVVIPVR